MQYGIGLRYIQERVNRRIGGQMTAQKFIWGSSNVFWPQIFWKEIFSGKQVSCNLNAALCTSASRGKNPGYIREMTLQTDGS